MTLRRTLAAAIGTTVLMIATASCTDGEQPTAVPQTVPTSPVTASATLTLAPKPTPSPSTTPSPTAQAVPLQCPAAIAVIAATDGVLNELAASSETMCAYGNTNTRATGSIQSEAAFSAKSLKGYRAALKSAKGNLKGIKTTLKNRPDLGMGAFQITISGGPSGAITSLVVPRSPGMFANISASRIKDGKFVSDLELTEELARAFLGR